MKDEPPPPIVVGGVGGGGTRVVSRILDALGVELGPVSVPSLDNVLFTTFFTLPAVARAPATFADLDALFLERAEWWDIFVKATTGAQLDPPELSRVEELVEGTLVPALSTSARLSDARKTDLLGRVSDALAHCRAARAPAPPFTPWGWKEPNASVFLPQIARRFPGLRYIHVIRHGLDMAYSGNVNQIVSWGRLFGMAPVERPDPRSCLEFWVKTNERTIAFAQDVLGPHFALVRFDDLVVEPGPAISALCRFLDVSADPHTLERLSGIPSVPRSLGRYRERDCGQFAPELIEKVRAFGFDAPRMGEPGRLASGA